MSELIDSGQERIDRLKSVIRGLHEGEEPAAVKNRLKELVTETSSDDIVRMEQQLMDEGMPVEEVKRMCDLHSEVVREVLSTPDPQDVPAGHPLDTFRRENEALHPWILEMRSVTTALEQEDVELTRLIPRWRTCLEALLEVDKHYARKENLLFSFLEQHGVQGPSQVMWGKDDDVRELLKALREALAKEAVGIDEWRTVATQIATPLCDQIEEMIFKEEKILLPMSHKKLTEAQWAEIFRGSARFGYTLVEPGTRYRPAVVDDSDETTAAERIAFSAGALTLAQLRAMVGVLPIDMTFVDADDRVAFFSEGPDRIFPRPKAVIGRKVHNCHPPKSVHIVERILDDFKQGCHDVAEFWVELGPVFAHIRYFAVRDPERNYLGTLEVTQNLAPLRALEGQRRLLQYADSADR